MIYQNTYPNYPKSIEAVKEKLTANQLAKKMILDSIENLIEGWQERISESADMTDKEQKQVTDALIKKQDAIQKYFGL